MLLLPRKNVTFGVAVLVFNAHIMTILAQSDGDFWWLNEKLVGVAKVSREKNKKTAHIITADEVSSMIRVHVLPPSSSHTKE